MGLSVQSLSAVTVRVKLASDLNWSRVYIYNYLDDAPAECGSWPGTQLVANADGWYSYTFIGEPGGVIFNNNDGAQFDAPEISEDVCFEIASAGISSVTCPANTPDPDPVVIRWKQISGAWPAMAIYAWGGAPVGETFGGWPGEIVTTDADGWYQVTVPTGQTVGHVIFNDGVGGDGSQFDADEVTTATACYEITTTSATPVTCPPKTGIVSPGKKQNALFTNPATSVITLASVKDIRSITIIGTNGERIAQPAVEKEMNVQYLPTGVYFLEIQSADGNVQYMKFIKK
ncbi:MAG: starch-binding protein [Dysgonamonadaceae bacterium]|nr:starch-binding protein [Dysgonamonadaceae bacterium]